MTTVRSSAPFDLCESSVGNRASGLFFLLLAVGAFFLAWSGVLELPVDMADFPLELVGSLFGTILTYMGLRAVFSLRGFRIDPIAKTIRRFRRGVFGRRYDSAISMADLDYLRFTLESRGAGGKKTVFYAVYLQKKTGEQLGVVATDLFNYARQMAERFARELQLDLHDDSAGGEAIIRKPDELDEPVRDKLRKNPARRSQPNVPFQMRPRIRNRSGELSIEIPRFDVKRLGPMQKVLWVFMIALVGGIAASYYWEIGGIALFCVPVFLAFAYLLLRSETIVVSKDSLSVSAGIGALKIKRQIPLAELEELYLTNLSSGEEKDLDRLVQGGEVPRNLHSAVGAIVSLGSAITASSDRKRITMGRMLSNAELDVVLYEMERRIRE